ncbi:hypothetical protein L195_g047165, partial [Trifolium pratense]
MKIGSLHSSPGPYATSIAYVNPYSPPPLTPYSSYVSQQQPPPIQYSTFPPYPHHLHDPSYHSPQSFTYPPYSSYHTFPNLTHITNHSATEPTMASHTPFLHQQPTHTHIFNHSQPIAATIPDVENLRSSLNEILEFIEEFRHEMKDSFLDAKKSFQALSDSFKLKTWDKKLPEKIVKKESEKQSAEEVEQLTQPPQQLSPSSVSTPMSTFTSSPWKPPSPSPNLLITQYLPPVPPITLPPSPLNPSPSPKLQPPPKPPEKVFFPFSPFPALSRPPPEPPDLQSTSESILPLPPTSRPPRKPPDHGVPTTLP